MLPHLADGSLEIIFLQNEGSTPCWNEWTLQEFLGSSENKIEKLKKNTEKYTRHIVL